MNFRAGLSLSNTTPGNAIITSAVVAIPNLLSGVRAKFIYVACVNLAFILPGTASTVVSSTTGALLIPNFPLILDVSGYTHMAFIRVSADGGIYFTALENN